MLEQVWDRDESVGVPVRAHRLADRFEAVLGAVADGVTVQGRDGRLVYANDAAARIIGYSSPEELLAAEPPEIMARFALFAEDGTPLSVADLPGRHALAGRIAEPLTLRFRVLATGEDFWSIVKATPLVGADGQTEFSINTFHDITARVRAEDEVRLSERRHRQLTEAMPQIAWITDENGLLVHANARWTEYTGIEAGRGAPTIDDETVHPDERAEVRRRWASAIEHDEPLEFSCRLLRRDGVYRWHLIRGQPIRDEAGGSRGWVVTSTDIDEAERAQANQRFLAEASALLGTSLDYEETLQRVARLAVPRIADWCVVDVIGSDGRLESLAVAHVDPDKVDLARDFRSRYPVDPDSPTGVAAVVRTGQPEMLELIDPAMIEAAPITAEQRQLLVDLQLRSYMCVPLTIAERTIGAITFVGAESGRTFRPDDLPFAESLAARAAASIENARLFREVLRHHQINDASPDAVFVIDPADLRIAYVNEGAAIQAGRTRAAMTGMAATDLLALDAARLEGLIRALLGGQGGSRLVTTQLRHADGPAVPVEVQLGTLSPQGEPTRIVAVARDITERIEAQARLERLAEAEHARAAELNAVIRAIGEAVFVCAEDGRVRLANPAAENLFPDVAEQNYDEIIAQLDFAGGEPPKLGSRAGPIEVRARGEPERWIEISTYPVAAQLGPGASARETIAMLRDVTEARQRQAVRDAFIGVLSHELRTPVTTIFGGSKILSRPDSTLSDEARRELFEDIRTEAERLHRLIEDVIALNRFGDDTGEIGREPILIQRILPRVVDSERSRWPGVNFTTAVPPGLPTVMADSTYVEQVIRNLLSNAAKYAGAGSNVEAHVETSGGEVVVTVVDDGPGFPAEDAERLFELFFRSPATAARASGAGIGLFVSARLVRAMGGRIWAQPRAEGGAEFGFALRVMDDA